MTGTRLLLVAAVLVVAGCSDSPLETTDTAGLSGLIVSEAHPMAMVEDRPAASTALVAHVSLPPGTLSTSSGCASGTSRPAGRPART